MCYSSQCSASGRACSAASDALREQSSPQPCCSACAVSRAPQQWPFSLWPCPVTETTRRPAAVAGAGERSSRPSRGVFGRRPTPSPRASAVADRGGRDGPSWTGDKPTQPSARSCAPDTARRRRRGVAAAPTSQRARLPADGDPTGTGLSRAQPECAHPRGPGETARQRRVDGSPTCGAKGGQRAKGRVPLEQTKPAPSEYPHATALGKFAAPRQNPHVLPPGFGFDPPEGWVDWVVWL